jgi:hypothetical protein
MISELASNGKKYGLPVYRIDKKSSRFRVFAYKKEIDQWFRDKT